MQLPKKVIAGACILAGLLSTGFHFSAAAQSDEKKNADSADYYRKELGKAWEKAIDSIKKDERIVTLKKQYDYYRSRQNNYSTITIFFDLLHSDYDQFNASIANSGFPALKPVSPRFGFGSSHKRNRNIWDFYLATAGFNNTSKKGEQKIKTSLSSVFQLDYGWDCLKSRVINLYPYIGISGRVSTLEYDGVQQSNPNASNISDLVTGQPNINVTSIGAGYQAGVGIDIRIGQNKTQTKSSFVFVKGGIANRFGKETYRINGVKYRPGIKQGDWVITVGFKFATKG
ncbi:MAG: hypothetical protein JST39_14195 [Bacteroidetes bacterium]|nr:hypothetical protein [Bacteroidota bacterium]